MINPAGIVDWVISHNAAIAAWLTVLVLMMTLMLAFRFRGKREVRVLYGSIGGNTTNVLFVKNTGAQDVFIIRNGYKYRDEKELHEFPLISFYSHVSLKPEIHVNLTLYDATSGNPPQFPDMVRVEYIYVRDSSQKIVAKAYFYKGKKINRWISRFFLYRDWIDSMLR